jgi:hypothetical protein
MDELLSQKAFAKFRGVSGFAVSSWKKRGLLVLVGGKVHVEASNKIPDARPRKYRGGTTSCRSGEEPLPNTPPLPDDFENWSLSEAQRKKEICLALTRQLQLDVARGKYLLREEVQLNWSRIVIAVRNAMLGLPAIARMRLQLSQEQHQGLMELVREVLTTTAMIEPGKDETSQ